MPFTTPEYAPDCREIESELGAIKRPGDYFAEGTVIAPMPTVVVKSTGTISFPVPEIQIADLITVASRAPYGRGAETVLDRSVRDCWQIDAPKVKVTGPAWRKTFRDIVSAVAKSLGAPGGRFRTRLYKLLVYQRGGFFASHTDTEKASGMVGTLVISLPTAGTGGDLVVRHEGREARIAMSTAVPSKLRYAAFYADCQHETLPLRKGNRVALVYNLLLPSGAGQEFTRAPAYSQAARSLSTRLSEWSARDGTAAKLVWVLEHGYSAKGLGFRTLKGADVAVARVLAQAAERAGFSLYLAMLHIEESGLPSEDYFGRYRRRPAARDVEMEEVWDFLHQLDAWRSLDGRVPELRRVPVLDGEVLPEGVLDLATPDKAVLHEATGNSGATLEHVYFRGALVFWPRAKALRVMIQAGMAVATSFVEKELDRFEGRDLPEAARSLVRDLLRAWPRPRKFSRGRTSASDRGRMVRALVRVDDQTGLARFLREIIRKQYSGAENDALIDAALSLGRQPVTRLLAGLVQSNFENLGIDLIDLQWRLLKEVPPDPDTDDTDGLRQAAVGTLGGLDGLLEQLLKRREWSFADATALEARSLSRLLQVGTALGLEDELASAGETMRRGTETVSPTRTVPVGLASAAAADESVPGTRAYSRLWRHAGQALLSRMADLRRGSECWVIDGWTGCGCSACIDLEKFCADSKQTRKSFGLSAKTREHLEAQIAKLRLPLDCRTVKRGRPYKLVCTKNPRECRLREQTMNVRNIVKLQEVPPHPGSEAESSLLQAMAVEVARVRHPGP